MQHYGWEGEGQACKGRFKDAGNARKGRDGLKGREGKGGQGRGGRRKAGQGRRSCRG